MENNDDNEHLKKELGGKEFKNLKEREKYFKRIFGKDFKIINQIDSRNYYKDRVKNALDKAWEVRNFEIGLYWKRATYFWAFIATIFIGFFAVLGDKNLSLNHGSALFNKNTVLFLISGFGVIFSFAWVLVNKGSKFWQENWEKHIFKLEFEYYGHIYSELSDSKKTVHYSVSKVNLVVSYFVTTIWLFIFVYCLKLTGVVIKFPKITLISGLLFIFLFLWLRLFIWLLEKLKDLIKKYRQYISITTISVVTILIILLSIFRYNLIIAFFKNNNNNLDWVNLSIFIITLFFCATMLIYSAKDIECKRYREYRER
ncbi:MAG: RipA family octameric membrane protein [bacterium]